MTMPNANNAAERVWAIVPAAGTGRRMGAAKQALAFRHSTLTGTVVRTLLDAGVDGIVVVTRTPLVAALALPDDPRVEVGINDDAGTEMIDSIRIGLSLLADRGAGSADGVVVVPADVPAVSTETCRRCIGAFAADPARIVIAACGTRRGHPIIFPFALRDVIDHLDGGLNELPRRLPDSVEVVETADKGVARDVDTPEDYDRLAQDDSA